MNGEPSTFTIGVIGFERAESRMLQQVVGLSEHRRPTFGPFNKERGGCPHVVVVNADQRDAMDKWNDFRRAHAHHASFAPIFVSGQPSDAPRPGPYVLYRPILTTQLFSMLDQVVMETRMAIGRLARIPGRAGFRGLDPGRKAAQLGGNDCFAGIDHHGPFIVAGRD